MTQRLPVVALLVLALAGDSPLFAQQVVRLRSTSAGLYLKLLPDGSLGANMDSLTRPDPDPNSHWVLEALPGSDQFLIRHFGTSRYLTVGTDDSVSLDSNRSVAQTWTIETDPKYPDPKSNVFRVSTQDGRFFSVGRWPFVRRSASITTPDLWWAFVWSFDLVDGKPAPANVTMTSRQIETARQNEANRVHLLNVAQAAQGCWGIDYANGNANFYVFSYKAGVLAVHLLSYAEDIVNSREVIMGGWSIAGEGSRFRPTNGILTDERGFTLMLNGRSATRIAANQSLQLQKILYSPRSGARGITEADCARLLESALKRY
jgi:hypothetical protein